MINTGGHLVSPFEVESALLEHEAVAESAVVAKPDEDVLSVKNVQNWIKSQKEQLTEYRASLRRDIKGAAAQVSSCEGYIRNLQYYLRHGDYCDDRYGAFQEKRISWQTIVPKG